MSARSQTNSIWRNVTKKLSESRTSTTVVADDAELKFTIPGAGIWVVDSKLFYFCGANPDFKFNFSTPALNSAWARLSRGDNQSNTQTLTFISANILNTDIPCSQAGTQFGVVELIARINVSAGGLFVVKWAQVTSDAVNAAQLASGSYIDYAQVGA